MTVNKTTKRNREEDIQVCLKDHYMKKRFNSLANSAQNKEFMQKQKR